MATNENETAEEATAETIEKLQNMMMDMYKKGYREGFYDFKSNVITVLSSIDRKDEQLVPNLIELFTELDYE